MKSAFAFVIAAAAGVVLSALLWSGSFGRVDVSHFEGVMGTSLEVRVQSRSPVAARLAEQAIDGEIARESKILGWGSRRS